MLDGYKTYLAAFGAVLIAVGTNIIQWSNCQPVDITLTVGALTALAVIFLRQGIKKIKG